MSRVALLVGVSSCSLDLTSCIASDGDIQALQALLSNPDWGAFDRIICLPNPDQATFAETLERWSRSCQADDVALLYVSGCGLLTRHDEVYFVASNTQTAVETLYPGQFPIGQTADRQTLESWEGCSADAPRKNGYRCVEVSDDADNRLDQSLLYAPLTWTGDFLRSTAIAASFIRQCLDDNQAAEQFVILDCSLYRTEQHDGEVAVDWSMQLGGDRRVILSATHRADYAPLHKQAGNSLYTSYLLEGIRTGAADIGNDGWLSPYDLHQYITHKLSLHLPALQPVMVGSTQLTCQMRVSHRVDQVVEQQYRQEVEQAIRDGEISAIGQITLRVLRDRLPLLPETCQRIEASVLRPYHQRQHSLACYEQEVEHSLQRQYPPSAEWGDRLQILQINLGLTEALVTPIRDRVLAKFATSAQTIQQQRNHETYLMNLAAYRQAYGDALRESYPLLPKTQAELQRLQQVLNLTDGDVQDLQSSLATQCWLEQQHQQQRRSQYQKEVERAIAFGIPLSLALREGLMHIQQSLGLTGGDAQQIESEVIHQYQAEQALYQQRLADYCRYLKQRLADEFPLTEATQAELERLQEQLHLNPDDVLNAQSQLSQAAAQQEIQYQQGLRHYEQELRRLLDQHGSLDEASRLYLEFLQSSLQLGDRDLNAIHTRVLAASQSQDVDPVVSPLSVSPRRSTSPGRSLYQPPELANQFHELAPQEAASNPSDSVTAPATSEPDETEATASSLGSAENETYTSDSRPTGANPASASSPLPSPPTSPPPAPAPTVIHASAPSFLGATPAVQADYTKLQTLLAAREWKAADEMTLSIMLRVTHSERDGYLTSAAIANLPDHTLREIDRLWASSSTHHFGFSVQHEMYQHFLRESQSQERVSREFAQKVGWWIRKLRAFKPYSQLSFNINAPKGHFPARWFWQLSPLESLSSGGFGNGRGCCSDILPTLMLKHRARASQ
jgi:hypothetical protein